MLDDNMTELLNKEHYPGKQADFEILRDAICRSCAPEYWGLEFDEHGLDIIKEVLEDCLLWRMGSIPIIPKRLPRGCLRSNIADRISRLKIDNPVPKLYAETLLKNPYFNDEVLEFLIEPKEYSCLELLKPDNFKDGLHKDLIREDCIHAFCLGYDLELLYVKYKYSVIFKLEVKAIKERMKEKIQEVCVFWKLDKANLCTGDLCNKRLADIIDVMLE